MGFFRGLMQGFASLADGFRSMNIFPVPPDRVPFKYEPKPMWKTTHHYGPAGTYTMMVDIVRDDPNGKLYAEGKR